MSGCFFHVAKLILGQIYGEQLAFLISSRRRLLALHMPRGQKAQEASVNLNRKDIRGGYKVTGEREEKTADPAYPIRPC